MAPEPRVVVLQVLPSLDAGGVERTTLEITEAVVKAGGRSLVASEGGRLEKELRAAGGELIRLPLASKSPFTIWGNADLLAAAAREHHVNIVHARSRAPAWSAYWAARREKLPFVTTYHGIYSANGALKRLYNSVMARGDLVIANSQYTRAHILAQYALPPEKVIPIPRGADLSAFDPARVDAERLRRLRAAWNLSAADPRPIIMVPARLSRWKGQDLLIDAAAQAGVDALYILAGDPQGRRAYVETLDQMIAQRGLKASVRRVGHVADMPAALALCEAAVFPPLQPEAFGRGAVEAQAMGKPVIAAAHGGLAETIVDRETGVLFEPGSAAALAGAIKALMGLPPKARAEMGAAGAKRARSLYSIATMQHATLDVYHRLLQDGRS